MSDVYHRRHMTRTASEMGFLPSSRGECNEAAMGSTIARIGLCVRRLLALGEMTGHDDKGGTRCREDSLVAETRVGERVDDAEEVAFARRGEESCEFFCSSGQSQVEVVMDIFAFLYV